MCSFTELVIVMKQVHSVLHSRPAPDRFYVRLGMGWRSWERRKGKPILAFASKMNLVSYKVVYSISFIPLGHAQSSSISFPLPQKFLRPRIATHFALLSTPQDPTLPEAHPGQPLRSPRLGALSGPVGSHWVNQLIRPGNNETHPKISPKPS